MSEMKKRLLGGIWAWMLERYPPGIILLHALAYLTSIALTQYLLGQLTLSFEYLRDGLGILVFFMFPLIIRIIDEHKDFETDSKLHPQRVLQRGDTSLGILRALAFGCALFQLGFCLWLDKGWGIVSSLWAGTMLYALLMGKEFFCGAWLEKRLVLYAITHQIITPISVFWFASMASTPALPPTNLLGFSLLCLLGTFSYEISRKIRPPEEEREGLDSYTKSIGRWQAPLLTIILFAAIGIGVPVWMQAVGFPQPSTTMLAIDALLVALCALCGVQFIRTQKKGFAKGLEAMSGVITLWMYGWILYASYTAREVLWTF